MITNTAVESSTEIEERSDAKRRKRVNSLASKISSSVVCTKDTASALQLMKMEAAAFFARNVPEELTFSPQHMESALIQALSATTSGTYEGPTPAMLATTRARHITSSPFTYYFDESAADGKEEGVEKEEWEKKLELHRTVALTLDQSTCLRVWKKLVDGLRLEDNGKVTLVGMCDGDLFEFRGGWDTAYTEVNAEQGVDVEQQRQCVFAFYKPSKLTDKVNTIDNFAKCFPEAAMLIEWKTEQVANYASKRATHGESHLLFGWNQNSHFSYHEDHKNYQVTYTTMLSPGMSSMHVAGATQEARYEHAGYGHMFDSQLYHRSGVTQLRTVKMSDFFVLDELESPETCVAGASSAHAGTSS